jgi:hypothetical protein
MDPAHNITMKLRLVMTVLVAVLSGGEPLAAQEPALGSFGFINGVDVEAPTFLKVNGRDYKVRGYRPGQMTMSAQLFEGPTTFAVTNEDIEGSAELDAPVAPDSPFILVAYVERTADEQGEVKEKLQLKKMSSRSSKEFKWSGLYLTARKTPATIIVGETSVVLEPMKLVSLPAKGGIEAMVEGQDERKLKANPDQAAHYMLVAYDKRDGGLGLLLYADDPAND